MNPFILNFTPTGMVPRRHDTPHVPISPEEIADQVAQAVEVGITMVHLHARDPDGTPSHDRDLYAEIIRRIRSFAPELVICVSLSGRLRPDFESRSAPLDLSGEAKPDMGSLTLSSLNFSRQASMNAPEMVQGLARKMFAKGILPELEAFDGGMINYADYLLNKKLLQPPCYFNLLLGNPANAQADPLSLGAMLAQLPRDSVWAAAGIGRSQTRAVMMGLAAGGGVRIGLEDNLHYDDARKKLATNLELVKRVHRLAAELERPLMSPAECRQRLNLLPGNGRYGRTPA
ncbi:3-keto-5-aminohexanoate cleavage protein [Geothermobacter hydrogeniphilus]|uniref:3-keto-5-aminohexanoate cleavage protein n=1 Tax=Geothermobacter hydrogeniphilus TaxID=1969733 RepID=A0A1X0XW83_9BACT|nr:3-keto-5-aminohexanoate cleavage protein [Geothermobacter hydrogeniphilus]ORJ57145.1 3-keto-5-aminohexanoate cleavage protein [Geothermobacter hydrogeniphilus]